MLTRPNNAGLQKVVVFLNWFLKALWELSGEILKTGTDDKLGIERLFKAQGTAWKGNKKEVCDDPAKEGNLKYTEIG